MQVYILLKDITYPYLIMKFKDKYLPAEEIVSLATKQNWGLYHIAPHVTSLEDIFVQLTQVQTIQVPTDYKKSNH